MTPTTRRRDAAVCALLSVAVFAAYRGAFQVYFLNEDFSWLWRCRMGANTIWTLLTRDVMLGLYSWRPLLQLWFGLNEAIWGVHPFGFRLAILVSHAAGACVLYAIGTQVGDWRRGALAALIFAVHPLHVESLNWTCAAGGPISTAFLLVALLGYLRWRRGVGSVWVVWASFALALATQETAVVFLALVVAADVLIPGPAPRIAARVRLYAGVIAVVAGFALLHRVATAATMNMYMVGFNPRWSLSPVALVGFVLRKLQVAAAMLLTLDAQPSAVILPIAAALALGALVCWWRGRPLGLWGLACIVIATAPFALLPLGPYPRHLYLALVGFAVLFAELLASVAEVLGRWNRRIAVVCVAGLMVLWLGYMMRRIDAEMAGFIERGRLAEALLTDLYRLVPAPRAGSTLAFYHLGDLRARQNVFVYGFDDAVRVLYDDASLQTQLGALGTAPDATYHFMYDGGRLALIGSRQP